MGFRREKDAKMPPKIQASKAAKALAAANASKGKKKKWSKGKLKEKVNNLVLFDKATYEKLIKVSTLSDRLRISGSLARAALKELLAKGAIKPVNVHHAQAIYTRAVGGSAE